MKRSDPSFAHGLRSSAAIAGWIISWGYPLSLLRPIMTTATQYSDDAWAVSFFIGVPIAVVAIALICIGGAPGGGAWFLVAPHFLTAFLGLYVLPIYLWHSTILGEHLAAVKLEQRGFTDMPTPAWHRAFAAAHFFCIAAFTWLAFYFRRRHRDSANVA